MPYKLIPFNQEHLQPAVELFINAYREERFQNPCLPSRVINEPDWIQSALQANLSNPGIAVVEQGKLLAFMVTGNQFTWKGQRAVIVPEYGHAEIIGRDQTLYQVMYQTLAKEWLKTNCHLHLIAHFSHNILLKETLYQLGFGALVAERVRDLSPIDGVQYQKIKEEKDISKLVDLHIEHILYYSQSPIFIPRTIDRPSALADLQSHVQNEDVLFVAYEQGQPCAYLIVGKSPIGSEGFLLQNTNSAQVKSAYAQPEVRYKGIGTALLNHAIRWAKQKGFERIFVEHETANIPGGNFWRKYFTPYLYFSMRYIDTTL